MTQSLRTRSGKLWLASALAGLVPLPILIASDAGPSLIMTCVYLGLASGWLTTEILWQRPAGITAYLSQQIKSPFQSQSR